ncbi:MAG TPA: hypothetical protein VF766_14345 [Pyrinomonadaceae bacterium]
MSNRRAQITSRDNHRVWFIRQGWSQLREFCAQCDERIQMMALEEASVAAGVELQTIHSLIEAKELHSLELDEGRLLVCLNSLINFRANSEKQTER